MSEQTPADRAVKTFPYPKNFLRIVIQTKDTPENQVVMARIVDAIKAFHIPDSAHSIVKAEQIVLITGCVAKPVSAIDAERNTERNA